MNSWQSWILINSGMLVLESSPLLSLTLTCFDAVSSYFEEPVTQLCLGCSCQNECGALLTGNRKALQFCIWLYSTRSYCNYLTSMTTSPAWETDAEAMLWWRVIHAFKRSKKVWTLETLKLYECHSTIGKKNHIYILIQFIFLLWSSITCLKMPHFTL